MCWLARGRSAATARRVRLKRPAALGGESATTASNAGGGNSGGSNSGGGNSGGGNSGGGNSGGAAGTGGEAACTASEKLCGTACTPLNEPATGCADVSCEPCAYEGAVAKCSGGECALDSCMPNFDDCDDEPSDCETPTGSDPNNCGWCGHDCQGANCNNGLCQPEFLLGGLSSVRDIALDDTHLYYVDNNLDRVSRIELDGGAHELVNFFNKDVYTLVLSSSHVFISGSSQVWRVPKEGGASISIATGTMYSNLAGNSTHVYFEINSGQEVHIARSEYNLISEDVANFNGVFTGGMVAADDYVYYANDALDRIARLSTTTMVKETLASNETGIASYSRIALCNGALYWPTDGNPDGTIRTVSIAGGTSTKFADVAGTAGALNCDDDTLYWGDETNVIRSKSLSGGPTRSIAASSTEMRVLMVVGDLLYFADETQIGRVAK